MLEALIALLLLTLGALGSAAGMTLALRGAHAARAQHQAVALLGDLGEMLRASAVAGRGPPAEDWQAGAAARMPPASRLGLVARVDRVASGAAGVEAWQARLEWRDRLSDVPLRVEERLELAQ